MIATNNSDDVAKSSTIAASKSPLLQDLPYEILAKIMEFMLGRDVARLGCCGRIFAYVASSDHLWKHKVVSELTSKPVLVDGDSYYRYYVKAFLGYKYHLMVFPRIKPPNDSSLRCYYQFLRYESACKRLHQGNYMYKSIYPWIAGRQMVVTRAEDFNTEINLFLVQAMRDGFDVWGAKLIRSGANIDRYAGDRRKISVPYGRSSSKYNHPVRIAIVKGQTHCLQLLLKHNANINHLARKRVNSTLFHLAAFSHQMDCLRVLITHVNQAYVIPDLHKIVMRNDFERLRLMLPSYSGDRDEQDRCCCTPLWWALILGHVKCASLLLQYHAKTTGIGGANESRVPTMSALLAVLRWKQLDCLKLLVERGYDIHEDLAINEYIGTYNALEFAARSNFAQGIEYLISEHAFSPLVEDCRALLLAATHGCTESLQILLREGAVIDQRLHLVSARERDPVRQIGIFLMLLQADESHSLSPLLSAAKYYHPKCLEMLLQAGANTHIVYGEYTSPAKPVALMELIIYNYFKKISLQPDKNPIAEELDTLIALLSGDDFILEQSVDSITAFKCLRLLLEREADVNACYQNGRSVLHELTYAVNKPQFRDPVLQDRFDKIIEYCLNMCVLYNADVNLTDKERNTPLHEAAVSLKPRWISLLLAAGARPDATNNELATPRGLVEKSIARRRNVETAMECRRLLIDAENKFV